MDASVSAKLANAARRDANRRDDFREELNRRDVEPIFPVGVEDMWEAVEETDAIRRLLRLCIEYRHSVLGWEEGLEQPHIRRRGAHSPRTTQDLLGTAVGTLLK